MTEPPRPSPEVDARPTFTRCVESDQPFLGVAYRINGARWVRYVGLNRDQRATALTGLPHGWYHTDHSIIGRKPVDALTGVLLETLWEEFIRDRA